MRAIPETRYCQTNRGALAYNDTGQGEVAAIFMHGLPTSKAIFDPLRAALDPRLRVITFDLHDYGESQKLDRPTTHPERARHLDALRAHLGLERFVLVAHDLGASVAVDYMDRYGDRVEKLVIMSPPVYPDFDEPLVVDIVRLGGLGPLLLFAASELLVDRSVRKGMCHPERYTPAIAASLHRAYAGRKGRMALLRNLRWGTPKKTFARYPAIIRGITAPTLVLQGTDDPYIPRSQPERMARDIVDARLQWIEGGGHFIPMDTPAPVAAAINGFVFG